MVDRQTHRPRRTLADGTDPALFFKNGVVVGWRHVEEFFQPQNSLDLRMTDLAVIVSRLSLSVRPCFRKFFEWLDDFTLDAINHPSRCYGRIGASTRFTQFFAPKKKNPGKPCRPTGVRRRLTPILMLLRTRTAWGAASIALLKPRLIVAPRLQRIRAERPALGSLHLLFLAHLKVGHGRFKPPRHLFSRLWGVTMEAGGVTLLVVRLFFHTYLGQGFNSPCVLPQTTSDGKYYRLPRASKMCFA